MQLHENYIDEKLAVLCLRGWGEAIVWGYTCPRVLKITLLLQVVSFLIKVSHKELFSGISYKCSGVALKFMKNAQDFSIQHWKQQSFHFNVNFKF